MRNIYHKAITSQEANYLLQKYGGGKKLFVELTNEPIVSRLISLMREDFNFTVKEQSYFRVEHMPGGHVWHTDTGDSGHMKWCELGSSVLLTSSFTGGETLYATDENLNEVEVAEREIFDLVAHTSDEWHKVNPHKGTRVVLLMFI